MTEDLAQEREIRVRLASGVTGARLAAWAMCTAVCPIMSGGCASKSSAGSR
jgi:hypothetical protein